MKISNYNNNLIKKKKNMILYKMIIKFYKRTIKKVRNKRTIQNNS